MKNTDDSHYKKKPSHATTKLTVFAVNKDEWNKKEDTGKHLKNALYYCSISKDTSWAETT